MQELIVEMQELAPLLRCGFLPSEFEVRGAKVSQLARELVQSLRDANDPRVGLLQAVAMRAACLTVEMRQAEIAEGRVEALQLPPLNQIYLNETAALLEQAVTSISEPRGTAK